MAKFPALVTALARVDGRDRKTVDHIGRTTREQHYIATSGRGGAAAEMSVRDAVNLMIALNGADSAKEAGLAIDRFRSLQQAMTGGAKELRERVASYEFQIRPIQAVMDAKTFGEALEALVETVPELMAALDRYGADAWPDNMGAKLGPYLIRRQALGIVITFRRYAAKIELLRAASESTKARAECVEFATEFVRDPDLLMDGFYGPDGHDRHVSVSVGTATLAAIWQALHPGASLSGWPEHEPTAVESYETAADTFSDAIDRVADVVCLSQSSPSRG